MKKILSVLALALLLGSCAKPEKEIYLFSYFMGNGDGLHLAYSEDGLTWSNLKNGEIILKPQIGVTDTLMRDPSIVQGPDSVFHMVWTSSWTDRGIGYASSKDLVHWSEQHYLPVMEWDTLTRNTWAPEIFYDDASKDFYIFWSSTIPGRFPEMADTEREKGFNHKQYCVTTKDFETFSPTHLYFAPEFSVIDGAILKEGQKYFLFIKNENPNPPQKNIRVTCSDTPADFPIQVSEPITGDYWAEGPAPLKVGDYVYVYIDKYLEHKYGAVRSKDMVNWEDVSDQVSFPQGVKHGTAFKVTESFFNGLRQNISGCSH